MSWTCWNDGHLLLVNTPISCRSCLSHDQTEEDYRRARLLDTKKDLPRTEIEDSKLSPQVLSLGNFLGQRSWGPVWNVSGKKYGSSGICTTHFPPLPPPYSFRSACLGAASLSLTNPTGRSLWFPGVSVGKKTQLQTMLPSLFFSSSSLDLVCWNQLLPGVLRHADIREPNPTRERGQGATNGPIPNLKAVGGLSEVFLCAARLCKNVKALGRRMRVPTVFSWGQYFFGLSNSRLPCR